MDNIAMKYAGKFGCATLQISRTTDRAFCHHDRESPFVDLLKVYIRINWIVELPVPETKIPPHSRRD